MEKENQILDIFIEEIIPNRFQPRLSFDEQKINELASSIKVHGIIQPLVVRKIGDKYEIVTGERRYKAATIAGLTKVPAVVVNIDDNQSAEIALVENLQRKDLTPIEEAKSFKKLLDRGYLSQEQLAIKMGVSQPSIANKLRLLNLDETVQKALLEEKISERHARSLLSLESFDQQRELLDKIQKERLTVKQLDEEIKNKQNGKGLEKMEIFDETEKIELISPSPTLPLNDITKDIEPKISTDNMFDLSQLANFEKNILETPVLEPTSEVFQGSINNSQPNIDNVFDLGQPIQENPINNDQNLITPPVLVVNENANSVLPEVQSNSFFSNNQIIEPIEQVQNIEQAQVPTFEELSVIPNLEIPTVSETILNPEKITIEEAIDQLKPEAENPQALYSSSKNIHKFELTIDKSDFRTIEEVFVSLKNEIIKLGLKIDMDTYNFDQYYQLIIKIYK